MKSPRSRRPRNPASARRSARTSTGTSPPGRYEIGYRDPGTGRWIMKRLAARNVTEAKRQVREILGKVETGEIRPADRSVTLRELVDAYLAHERGAAGTLAATDGRPLPAATRRPRAAAARPTHPGRRPHGRRTSGET